MNVNFEQLVKKARKGDQDAMTDLYAATSQQVYFAALKLVGNQPDAEDIASETYITAFSNLERLAEPAAFSKWVRVIAVNLAKDFLKKKKPVMFNTDEEEQRILGSVPEESEDCLPEVFAERRDLRRQVVELIDALPEAQRATVYLHYMEGHSVEEVAEIMEVNENTVKSRLNYARSKLRKLAERSGLTLGAVSVITLALRAECAATAVPFAVNKAVIGAIGAAGASAAAAGTVASGAAATGTAATTAAKAGIGAKIAAMGIGAKVAAVAVAGALVVAGGIGVSNMVSGEEVKPAPEKVFMETVENNGGFEKFIGKTGNEIIEIFGDEFDYTIRTQDDVIDYHLDNTVGFMFTGEVEESAVCTNIYTFSAVATVPELYGADREGVMKYISDNSFKWSEGEPAEFDNASGIGADDAQFILFIYDGNIRYVAVSDENGIVTHVDIMDYVLYEQELDKKVHGNSEPEAEPEPTFEYYRVSHEFYIAGEEEKENSISGESVEVWDYENVEDVAAGIEKIYEGGEENYLYVRTEIDYENRWIYVIYEREAPVDIMQLYENVSGYKGTRKARILVDMTRDGVPELIVISTDEVYGWVNVYTVKNREAVNIWQYTSGSTVRDNDSICLYEKGGYYYFLTLDLQNDNGNVDYRYKAFWLDENGAEQEIFSDRFVGKFSDSRSMELIANYNELIKDVVVDMLVGDSRGIFHYSGDTTFCDLDFASSNTQYSYISSIDDGEYEWVYLTGEFSEVNGGVMGTATYNGEGIYLFFPDDGLVLDQSSSMEIERDDIRQVARDVLSNGAKIVVKNGAVTKIIIYFHP